MGGCFVVKLILFGLVFGASVMSQSFAQSDYQLVANRAAVEQEITQADSYDSQDITRFKEKAIQKSSEARAQGSHEPIELAAKIETTLKSFGKRIDKKLRADLEKALVSSLQKSEVVVPKPVATTSIQNSSARESLDPTKKARDRIAEINRLVSNPSLPWAEFEKLMDERNALQSELKSLHEAFLAKAR